MTTSPIPYEGRTFELELDFTAHRLDIRSSDGRQDEVPLRPQTVAAFYNLVMEALRRLDLDIRITRKPSELVDPIPFSEDEVHRTYDAECVHRFWLALVQVDRVFKIFRGRFIGKASPVHYFWGAGDLAVTRFSGRRAPEHPGGIPNLPDWITREAYSHEVSSCGFWPGGGAIDYPAFYSYAYPAPAGFADARVGPEGRSTVRTSVSSSCRMIASDVRHRPLPFSSFSSQPTRPRRHWATGIALHSKQRHDNLRQTQSEGPRHRDCQCAGELRAGDRVARGVTVRRALSDARQVDFSLAFVTTQKEIDSWAKAIARKAGGDAIVWLAYPKKSSKKVPTARSVVTPDGRRWGGRLRAGTHGGD